MPVSINCCEDYDDKFEKHENIKIWPFIGEGYYDAKPKIMILGESPYWEKNEPPPRESTRYNLTDYIESIRENGSTPQWAHATIFRNLAAMITGKGFKESDEKWYDMAFYNFYQFIIGENANDKSKLSQENIILSQKAFFDVVKILSPDFIIACGVTYLFNSWLPQEGREIPDEIRDKEKKVYKYKTFPNTVIWHIHHPSRGFELNSWQEEYKAVVKNVCELRTIYEELQK